jgi:5-carboxymethyl-2-hydroxymuconate isomerase
MPHLVILYTPNLDRETDLTALCRALADTMLGVHDEDGKQVFPTGGTRVLAYPAAHFAVADGGAAGRAAATHTGAASGDPGDYAFVYLNLRMGRGRSAATHKKVGEALLLTTKTHFQTLFTQRHIGITLQIDEGQEVFDAKHSNLHHLFVHANRL